MNLTEIQKVAVLLIALGPQRAQRILDHLNADELLSVIEAMAQMRQVSPDVRRAVLLEVNAILTARAARRPSGVRRTPPRAPQRMDLFDRIDPDLPDRIDPDRIDWGAAGFDFGQPPEDRRRRWPPGEDP